MKLLIFFAVLTFSMGVFSECYTVESIEMFRSNNVLIKLSGDKTLAQAQMTMYGQPPETALVFLAFSTNKQVCGELEPSFDFPEMLQFKSAGIKR